MVDLLVSGGTVVTVNEQREVLTEGAVAVDDGQIVAVGTQKELDATYDFDDVIDATGHAVLPGFINTHTHVNDILLRGGIGTDRTLYDWGFSLNRSALAKMTTEEHELSAALWCLEAVQSGITTFVDNAGGYQPGLCMAEDNRDVRLDVYERSGLRAIFAHAFIDADSDDEFYFDQFIESYQEKYPSLDIPSVDPLATEDALDAVETMIETSHGRADGRLSVWPAPLFPWAVTPEGLRGALDLARKYDVQTTTHVSEVPAQERFLVSSIEHLNNIGYLDDRVLLGHCVHLDERDMRLLAASGTKVAHNVMTNLALGSGVAPVPAMQNYGITVGLGTDNSSASDTVNLLNDARFAAMLQKGHNQDPGAMTAEKALEMLTIDGARAIGRADDLGSLEAGKRADIVVLNLDYPHLTPAPNVPSAVIYQTQGFEVETVLCDGEIILQNRDVPSIEHTYPALLERAESATEDLLTRSGLDALLDRPWTAVSGPAERL